MSFPLLVRPMRLAFEAIDPELERAASTLARPPYTYSARITLPLALPGIIAGALLAFAKALGEFGATITFVSNIPGETQTIPSAIYCASANARGDAAVVRLALVSVAISIVALIVSDCSRALGLAGQEAQMISVSCKMSREGFDLDVAFEAGPGVLALVGASGSGKTTILNLIAGIEQPDHGIITLDGKKPSSTRREVWLRLRTSAV